MIPRAISGDLSPRPVQWTDGLELLWNLAATAGSLFRSNGSSGGGALGALGLGVLGSAVAGSAVASYLKKWRPRKPPRVSRLFIHPLKGAAPLEVPSARLDRLGFVNDRRWAVLDMKQAPRRRVVHGAIKARIVLLRPELDDHLSPGARLTLKAPAMPDLEVESTAEDAERIEVALWDMPGVALDCGPKAAEWLERFFGESGLRLAYLSVGLEGRGTQLREPCKEPTWSGGVESQSVYFPGSRLGFADETQGTMLSAASLEDLNRRIPKGLRPASLQQFRMNVILSGTMPYEEETWRSFRIDGIEFVGSKLCSRCTTPNVDPDTGDKVAAKAQPLRLLSRYRGVRHVWHMDPRHEGPAFGLRFGGAVASGTIHVGDSVTHIGVRSRADRMF